MEKRLASGIFLIALFFCIFFIYTAPARGQGFLPPVCDPTTGCTVNEQAPVCGHPPDSLIGFGEVVVNPFYFSCDNVPDGICPEDYQDANNASIFGNCTSCIDPDCIGTISGYVFDYTGLPVPRAVVTSRAIKWNATAPSLETSTNTSSDGKYTLIAPTGMDYYFSAAADSYDTELKRATVLRNKITYLNFSLPNGTCHPDCTNSFDRCNAKCQGLTFDNGASSCNFFNETIMSLCDNRLKGTDVYVFPYNATHAYFVSCCEGLPTLRYYAKANIDSSKIRDLVKIEKIARYNDIPVRIVVAYWP